MYTDMGTRTGLVPDESWPALHGTRLVPNESWPALHGERKTRMVAPDGLRLRGRTAGRLGLLGQAGAGSGSPGVPVRDFSPPRPDEGGPDGDEQDASDRQEPEIPTERSTEIIADVVKPEYVMVNHALDQVEQAEAQEEPTEVRAPRRRQFAALPGA